MLRRFSQLLVLLLPLGVFALALPLVQQRLFGGQATSGILLLLVGLALLALAEGLLFRYWILPGWGDKMAERLYAGSYLPEQDELALLLERVAREKSVDDLPLVEKMVRRQPRRLRGWLELDFPRGFTCPAVLWIQLDSHPFQIRGCHTLWPAFPCRSSRNAYSCRCP